MDLISSSTRLQNTGLLIYSMEKEEQTFSTPPSTNYSVSHNKSSHTLNTSLFSAHQSTSVLENAQNFQPHNPYMKRHNHMLVKMLGKINGQPIIQSSYKLQTFKKDEGGRGELQRIQAQNRQLSLKVRALQETILRMNQENERGRHDDDHRGQVRNFSILRSKLAEKQYQNSILFQTLSKEKMVASSLQSQLRQAKQSAKRLEQQLALSKQQKQQLMTLASELRKGNQQMAAHIVQQGEEILRLKSSCSTSSSKVLQKQVESLSNQLLSQRQSLPKLQKENQILKEALLELSKVQNNDNNPDRKLNQIKNLQLHVSKLQRRILVNDWLLTQDNQQMMKDRLRQLNEQFKSLVD